MSKWTDIKAKINMLEGGAFQELCDALLSRKGYEGIHAYGMQAGTMKTTKGNPDTYFKSKTGKYIFVAYTTQKDYLFKKAKEDIEKCLDPIKTGIQESDIEEIIFCHTSSNLSAGEDKALKDMCAEKGILFDIYGIDRIADEIYQNYKILAKDHLGLSIDTNQILEQRDFIDKYDSNEMLAPLSTIFQFRKDEYNEIMLSLKNKKIVAVIGKAGVGKTRLSLEVAKNFGYEGAYRVFCIKSMDLSIFEDITAYMDKPGKYLFFIDDANELGGLKYVLEYINMEKLGYDVKIITTMRDYTAQKVINEISSYTNPHIIHLNAFTDEQIKEFLNVNMQIRHRDYVDVIIRIAEGNPRIAYMAGKLANEEQSLAAINNATQLYETYYNKFLHDSAIITDWDLCLTASIISLLHSINLSDLTYLESLLEKLCISKEQLKKMIFRLCEQEFVEIKINKVATISDQCLRNYMLYYAFVKRRIVPYSELMEIGFKNFRNGITKATSILWNIFSSEEVHNYLASEIEKVWDIYKQESEELFYEFIKYFHDFRPEEVLLIVKNDIDKVESDEICIDEIDFSKESYHTEDRIVEFLSGYANQTLLPESIELLCEYVIKKQSAIVKIIKCLKVHYNIDKDSYKYDYYTVNQVVKVLKTRRSSTLVTKIFLEMAKHYLKVLHRPSELGRGSTLVTYTIPIVLTEGSKKYRQGIWEELILITEENVWDKDIRLILENYAEGWTDEVEREVFEFDKKFIIKLVDKLWHKDKIRYGILCQKMRRKWKHYGIEVANEFDKVFKSEKWKIYEIFSDKRLNSNLSYEEAIEKRKCEIQAYANSLTMEGIEELIVKTNQIVCEIGREKYDIIHGLEFIAEVLFDDKDKLYYFLQMYFENGKNIDINPYVIIKKLIELFGVEYVYNFICNYDYPQKNSWQFVFFEILPKQEVNVEWLEKLIYYLNDKSDKKINNSSYRDIKFLDNYIEFEPQIYCIVARIIMKKQEYNTFIVQIYLVCLFNSYTWKPQELLERFSKDIELLKNIYFYAIKLDSKTDYDGKFIKYFVSVDNSWIELYAKYFFENTERLYLYEHDRIMACWELDNYIEIFDYLFGYVIEMDKYAEWTRRYDFRNIVVHEEGKHVLNERKDEWILHIIEQFSDDSRKMIVLFKVLSELGMNIREKAIIMFIRYNKDYDLFTKLSLEPNHWNGIGSMQAQVKFYENLLVNFTGINLLKHKQHIQENMKIWKERIEWQEIREAMEMR
ncbi:MAG: hypothetical protein IKW08_06370 [Roseburia sp.]|nr:hypothetical protein [Roseburia sp.]